VAIALRTFKTAKHKGSFAIGTLQASSATGICKIAGRYDVDEPLMTRIRDSEWKFHVDETGLMIFVCTDERGDTPRSLLLLRDGPKFPASSKRILMRREQLKPQRRPNPNPNPSRNTGAKIETVLVRRTFQRLPPPVNPSALKEGKNEKAIATLSCLPACLPAILHSPQSAVHTTHRRPPIHHLQSLTLSFPL